MNAKTTIRKILFIAIWLCIGGVMVTLLLAAITKKNNGICKGYTITIEGAKNNLFIDSKDVEQLLFKATMGPIKGDPIASLDLYQLEQMLRKNNWIEAADLYFDNKDILHISVTESEPSARIFTTEGNSFYLNGNGKKMPLSDKMSARVPLFTGYIDKQKMNAADSLFLKKMTTIANFIAADSFWISQVAQINITNDKEFEMVPLVGNHLVKLGNGEHIERKLNRLMVFYKQVLSKAGFDKYKIIDVQYKGQVVVSNNTGDTKVDSIQLRRNVEKLLKQSEDAEKATAVKVLPAIIKLEKDSVLTNDPELIEPKSNTTENKNNTIDKKPSINETEKQKKETPKTDIKKDKPKPEQRKPKAVMPPKVPVENENGHGYN